MRTLNYVLRGAMLLAAAAIVFTSLEMLRVSGDETTATATPPTPGPTAEQIADLERTLCGAALVGHFTEVGQENAAPLSEERYELGDVKHLGDGQWLLPARIKYGENDVTLPLTLPIRWAGDTPTICLDETPIPGFGAFSARVMIYKGRYAGVWLGKDHGGHLFGVIERSDKDDVDRAPAQVPDQ